MNSILATFLVAAGLGVSPSTPVKSAPRAAVSGAVAVSPESSALAASLDPVIDQALADQRIVGAVVIVAKDGEVLYRRAAGFEDREAKKPLREDAVFRLASMTKPLVSVAALALVDQGKLSLEDPVTKWLPTFRPKLPDGREPVITVKHLLTHTAGMMYGFNQPVPGPYQKAQVSDGLDNPPGLKDTSFRVSDVSRLATPYVDGKPAPVRMDKTHDIPFGAGVVHYTPGRALDTRAFPSGGAGMVGTASDYVKFLEALRKGGAPVLKQATVEQLGAIHVGPESQPQGPGWGWGLASAVLIDPAQAHS